MPKIIAPSSFDAVLEEAWCFEPVGWARASLGPSYELVADGALRSGWSTGAVHEGRVLYLAGVIARRWWDGRIVEAEVWMIPCEGWEAHLSFAWRHAKSLTVLQQAYRIPRLVAHVLAENAFGSHSAPSLKFLRKMGFRSEGVCSEWHLGASAWQMARTVNFERAVEGVDSIH